jgi:hypothetical protein
VVVAGEIEADVVEEIEVGFAETGEVVEVVAVVVVRLKISVSSGKASFTRSSMSLRVSA